MVLKRVLKSVLKRGLKKLFNLKINYLIKNIFIYKNIFN